METKNIYWLKSKMFLTNLFTAIFTVAIFFIEELSVLLNENFEFLKGITEGKYLAILIVVICVLNAFAKTRNQQDKVVLKKKNCSKR